MIGTLLRILLLGGIVFGAAVAAVNHLPATAPRAQAPVVPADAQPATPRRSMAQIATSVETPLGDASFRAWCTWTLRQKLAEQADWPLPRVASLCLCIANRARERSAPELPDLSRADFVAGVRMLEERLCRRA
ncbi:hypothetical protein GWK16_08770 [Roseomonas sp. JC162]|uniref:Uncharacterized protein n=1 Tax=Neoroseomonas marina TaxID=1232220 RepID=A0A848ECV0_9PROT|nr:hypothetical protein [Neoroseomonas marina]NMJ41329.1 hypothetical protein [Neoroseomonas marina]